MSLLSFVLSVSNQRSNWKSALAHQKTKASVYWCENGSLWCTILLGTNHTSRCGRYALSIGFEKWTLSGSREVWGSWCLCNYPVLPQTVTRLINARRSMRLLLLLRERFYHYRIDRLPNDHVVLAGSRAQEKFASTNNDGKAGVNGRLSKNKDQKEFPGPMELISYFQKNTEPLVTTLSLPCQRLLVS